MRHMLLQRGLLGMLMGGLLVGTAQARGPPFPPLSVCRERPGERHLAISGLPEILHASYGGEGALPLLIPLPFALSLKGALPNSNVIAPRGQSTRAEPMRRTERPDSVREALPDGDDADLPRERQLRRWHGVLPAHQALRPRRRRVPAAVRGLVLLPGLDHVVADRAHVPGGAGRHAAAGAGPCS